MVGRQGLKRAKRIRLRIFLKKFRKSRKPLTQFSATKTWNVIFKGIEVSAMNNLIRAILKTAVYFLDQTDRVTGNVRDRVSDSMDRAADTVSDLRDRAEDLYEGPSHTMRSVLMFAAGVGVGIGTAMLFAPASGEEFREQIGQRVQNIGARVKSRFSSSSGGATGTEGM
jgi:gas vesicle protein